MEPTLERTTGSQFTKRCLPLKRPCRLHDPSRGQSGTPVVFSLVATCPLGDGGGYPSNVFTTFGEVNNTGSTSVRLERTAGLWSTKRQLPIKLRWASPPREWGRVLLS